MGELDDGQLDALMGTAGRLMRGNLAPVGRPERHRVYGRAGRPCPRCGTIVQARAQGHHARTAYWCPTCQTA